MKVVSKDFCIFTVVFMVIYMVPCCRFYILLVGLLDCFSLNYFIVDCFSLHCTFFCIFKMTTRKSFFKRTMFRTTRFITKRFSDNTKIDHRKYFSMLFFSNQEPKNTPSSNRLSSGKNLIITSLVTDVFAFR